MRLKILFKTKKKFSKKKPTVDLPKISKLLDSAITKRQEDKRKHSFLEREKSLHKRENGFNMSIQNISSLDGSGYEAILSSISQNFLLYLKMFSMQCRKNIITIYIINKYIFKYIYLYYMWQNDNKLVSLAKIIASYFLLQDFHIWSKSQTVEMEGSYNLPSYKN